MNIQPMLHAILILSGAVQVQVQVQVLDSTALGIRFMVGIGTHRS